MTEKCSFCGDTADPAVAFRHRTCGHVSHARCMNAPGVKRDLFNCARVACGGTVIEKSSISVGIDEEPRPQEVRDYVLNPGPHQERSGTSTTTWVASKLGLSKEAPLEQSQDPYVLLQNQVPIKTMIMRNKVGLQHICKAGVTLGDFLQCGYTLRDLVEFKDISGSKGKQRALQALAIGLRANANQFRDYADAFPIEGVRHITGMDANAICEYFGLSFPHALAPLQCQLDAAWRAGDVLKLGLTIDNLCDFGLQTTAQYDVLTDGLSEVSREEVDRRLGVTQRHRSAWAKADAIILEQLNPTPIPTVIRESPVIRAPQQTVEQQQQQTIALPPPVIHHHVPQAAAAVASSKSRVTAPIGYEQKAQQRAKLHGFLG